MILKTPLANIAAQRPGQPRWIYALLLLALMGMMPLAKAQSRLQIVVKDSLGAPVADAAVMLLPVSGTTLPARLIRRDVAIHQIDREFVPRVSIVALGSRVSFPNIDVVQHSVYSFSKAKSFEIPIYAGESPQIITLDKAGVVILGCNIHDWMVGYIVVADAPIAELTKAEGTVTVPDLPRGNYTARVWHPKLKGGEITEPFTIEETAQQLEIKLNLQPVRAPYKPPLNVKQY